MIVAALLNWQNRRQFLWISKNNNKPHTKKDKSDKIREIVFDIVGQYSVLLDQCRPRSPRCYLLFINLMENVRKVGITQYLKVVSEWIAIDSLPKEFANLLKSDEFISKMNDHGKSNTLSKILHTFKLNFFKENNTFLVIVGHSAQYLALQQIAQKLSNFRENLANLSEFKGSLVNAEFTNVDLDSPRECDTKSNEETPTTSAELSKSNPNNINNNVLKNGDIPATNTDISTN